MAILDPGQQQPLPNSTITTLALPQATIMHEAAVVSFGDLLNMFFRLDPRRDKQCVKENSLEPTNARTVLGLPVTRCRTVREQDGESGVWSRW